MSNHNEQTTLPSFNNNRSLYGSKTQANKVSKKISIIQDKLTQEPVQFDISSTTIPSTNSGLNINAQRSISTNISSLPERSPSQLRKQIEIEKEALNSFDLKQVHSHVYQELDEWKNSMHSRVQSIKTDALDQNNQWYQHDMVRCSPILSE